MHHTPSHAKVFFLTCEGHYFVKVGAVTMNIGLFTQCYMSIYTTKYFRYNYFSKKAAFIEF